MSKPPSPCVAAVLCARGRPRRRTHRGACCVPVARDRPGDGSAARAWAGEHSHMRPTRTHPGRGRRHRLPGVLRQLTLLHRLHRRRGDLGGAVPLGHHAGELQPGDLRQSRRAYAWHRAVDLRPGGGPAHAGAPSRPHAAAGDARTSRAHDPASPPWIASTTACGETPAFWASTRASETAAMFSATTTWLASFAMFPAPISPTKTTEAAMSARTCWT